MLGLRIRLGLAVAMLLGAVQPAAAQLMFGIAPPEKKETYVTDASQVPVKAALSCFALMSVGLDHPDVRIHDEAVERPMMKAMQDRVDGEIKRTNQQGDAVALAGPIRRQLLQQ